MATDTFYPSAGASSPVDGYTARVSSNSTFSSIRSGSGTSVSDTSTDIIVRLNPNTTTDRYDSLWRGIVCFDTSSLPDDAVISSASINLYGVSKISVLGETPMHAVAVTTASNSSLSTGDHSNFSSTSFGNITYASFTTSAYNAISLNSSGLSHINKTGITKFGLVLEWDLNNSFTGTWAYFGGHGTTMQLSSADTSGSSQDPYLSVTYTTGGANTTNFFAAMV